jgi:hypothetical protein
MGSRFYLAEDFENPQENSAFRHLCSAGSEYLIGDTLIIGNILYQGGQIDALVVRRRSIIVVDFKDYGGAVRISEDKEWITEGGTRIKGGMYDVNPFAQVVRYKKAVMRWLRDASLLSPQDDVGHVSGLVIFTQPMEVDATDMGWIARKWFHAGGQQAAMDFLRDQASPSLDVSPERMDTMLGTLDVKPYRLLPGEAWVPASTVQGARNSGYFDAMQDVEDAERAAWWAENGERIQAEYAEACRGWAIQDGWN